MSNRLDKQRESKLQPVRYEIAVDKLTALGYEVYKVSTTYLTFWHKGHPITFYPYSGWFTGKLITDGRGLENLLKQLK